MKVQHVVPGLAALGSVIVILGMLGFRFNVSTSLPRGVYLVTSDPPSRGSIVYVCLAHGEARLARSRGYLGPGSCPGDVRPLGKLVLAVAGDVVTLSRDDTRVNGTVVPNSAAASEDSHGRPLPRYPWGDHRLGANEFWLFSSRGNAYDSRYFGPVKSSQIVSVLRPLWTEA